MFYAIVTSGPMAEHNNGRLNTIGLGLGRASDSIIFVWHCARYKFLYVCIGPAPPATHDDVR